MPHFSNEQQTLLDKIEDLGFASQDQIEGLSDKQFQDFAVYRDTLIRSDAQHSEEIKSAISDFFDKGRQEAEQLHAHQISQANSLDR